MNKYQLEVAKMDHRRQWTVRVISFIGAGVLVILALWSAGLPPHEWLARAQQWIDGWRAPPPAQPGATPAASPHVAEVPAQSSQAAGVPAGTESSLSTTPQPLYLLATAPGRNAREGTAQIGTNPDNPQTYIAGAVLANGARISEIHRDHVVLTRGESSAKLLLFRRNGPQGRSDNELLNVGGESHAPIAIAPSREVLTDYLRPNPIFDGEILRGYEVYPGTKSGVFAQLGLMPGDVITTLNGVPFSDPVQGIEMLRQLTDGITMTATLRRKNVTHQVTLDGTLISADQENSRQTQATASPAGAMPPS